MQASGNLKILTGSLWFLGLTILTAFVLHSSFQFYYISFFFCCPVYLIHGPFIWCWKICFLLDFHYELNFFFPLQVAFCQLFSLTRVFSFSLAVRLQVLDSKDHAFWDCFLVCSTSSIWLVMSVASRVRWNAHCVLWLRLMYQTSLLYLAVDSGSSLWGLRGLPVDIQVLSGKKEPWTPFEEGRGWQPHCFSYAGVVLFWWLKRWRCEKKMKWNRVMWLAGRTSRGQRVSRCLPGSHVPCTPGRWKSSSKKPAGEAFASEGAESPRICNRHGDPESGITVWGYQQVKKKNFVVENFLFFFFLGRVIFHCTGSCWMCLWDGSFKRKTVCSSWFPVWGMTFPDLGNEERVRTHRDSSSLQLSLFLFFFLIFWLCWVFIVYHIGCSLLHTGFL